MLDTQIHKVVRKMLAEWDPVGVRGMPGAEGEYDAYVPEVVQLINRDPSEEEIFSYLWQLETDHMGLVGNEEATKEFARRLLALR